MAIGVSSSFVRFSALGAAALAAGLLLSGCAGVVASGASVGGVGVVQERPLERGAQDVATAAQLRSNLFQAQFDDLFLNVSVLVVEGRALLTGMVRTQELKARAVELARQTEGVIDVLDGILIGPEYGIQTRLLDIRISTEIRARLVGTIGSDQLDFWTTTTNGVVYLMGIAENEQEITAVTDVARNVRGVKKVVNFIMLHDDPRRLRRNAD